MIPEVIRIIYGAYIFKHLSLFYSPVFCHYAYDDKQTANDGCIGMLSVNQVSTVITAIKTRKRFSEKPIVAFTNNTVFMIKLVLISCCGLECLDFEESSYKQLMSMSCDKRVQMPGMSPPRAGSWTYCLFTP